MASPYFGTGNHAYNEGQVVLGQGFEASGGRDGSLVDDEIYRTVAASASLGNMGGYTKAVIGDGSGREIYMGGNPQQGGYNGTEMDEALNNDMTGVTEAGYSDKIATGIDRIKGDYSTLPLHMQQLFTKLRALAKSEGIDLERTFQDAGGSRFGTISKRLFQSALCIAFQHYTFSPAELDEIVEAYDCGLPDTFNGGLLEVGWRDFVNDVLSATVIAKEIAYEVADMDATDAGFSDLIATGIDRIQGGFEDLPPHIQQCLSDLRKMAKIEGINLEMTMQDAGGTRFGTIGKRHFISALGIAFQHYVFTPEMYDDLAKAYGCGDDDRFGGGKTLVAWRDFCNDFLASRKFDSQGLEVKHAGNDGIAGGGNTSYVHTIPGAQK